MVKPLRKKSKDLFLETDNLSGMTEEFVASTEEISTTGEEQLALTEAVAQSSKDLYLLVQDLNAEINKIKI